MAAAAAELSQVKLPRRLMRTYAAGPHTPAQQRRVGACMCVHQGGVGRSSALYVLCESNRQSVRACVRVCVCAHVHACSMAVAPVRQDQTCSLHFHRLTSSHRCQINEPMCWTARGLQLSPQRITPESCWIQVCKALSSQRQQQRQLLQQQGCSLDGQTSRSLHHNLKNRALQDGPI